jgi:hypothetical protein
MFKVRFPSFSMVTHIPTFIAEGLAAEFVSGQANLLAVCAPESWPVEILKARELAGETELRVCQIFLSGKDLFVHPESSDVHVEFVWISWDELHLFGAQCQQPQTLTEFVNSMMM